MIRTRRLRRQSPQPTMLRLHPAPPAADGADPARHHGDQLLHHPGGARRAGRAGDLPQIRARGDVDRPVHRRRRDGGSRRRRRPPGGEQSAAYRGAPRPAAGADRAHPKQYGFDKPIARALLPDDAAATARSTSARASSATRRVVDLVIEKMPVSISLGLWTTLLIYLISIPLGIRKAVRDGSRFDVWTSVGRHRRLRHPGLPVRPPAGRAVRRRQLLADGSRCAASSPTTGDAVLGRTDRSTISGTWCCRSPPW